MAWTVGEHLLATATTHLGHIAYVTAYVNSDEKSRKQMQFPEPIRRPGETPPVSTERRHGRRSRTGAPVNPALFGGEHIETTAQEVPWQS